MNPKDLTKYEAFISGNPGEICKLTEVDIMKYLSSYGKGNEDWADIIKRMHTIVCNEHEDYYRNLHEDVEEAKDEHDLDNVQNMLR